VDKSRKNINLSQKLDVLDKKTDSSQIKQLFTQEVEDRLELLLEKLENERNVILSHGLMKREVVDVKISVQKEIELEKL
jgi:hypothetical protein